MLADFLFRCEQIYRHMWVVFDFWYRLQLLNGLILAGMYKTMKGFGLFII